jgi:hypothetical protein
MSSQRDSYRAIPRALFGMSLIAAAFCGPATRSATPPATTGPATAASTAPGPVPDYHPSLGDLMTMVVIRMPREDTYPDQDFAPPKGSDAGR